MFTGHWVGSTAGQTLGWCPVQYMHLIEQLGSRFTYHCHWGGGTSSQLLSYCCRCHCHHCRCHNYHNYPGFPWLLASGDQLWLQRPNFREWRLHWQVPSKNIIANQNKWYGSIIISLIWLHVKLIPPKYFCSYDIWLKVLDHPEDDCQLRPPPPSTCSSWPSSYTGSQGEISEEETDQKNAIKVFHLERHLLQSLSQSSSTSPPLSARWEMSTILTICQFWRLKQTNPSSKFNSIGRGRYGGVKEETNSHGGFGC